MMFITPKIRKHNNNKANSYKKAVKQQLIKKKACIDASVTVEAAIVIPVFIYAVMAVMYFIQVMAIRAHVNDALYITLRKSAGYAYAYENLGEYAAKKAQESGIADGSTIDSSSGTIKKGMAVETIRRMFLKELDDGYAEQNNIANGAAGFIFISTKVLQGNSVIDIKVSYYIKNPFDIFGQSKIKIADRKRINAWLGEDKDGYAKTQTEEAEYVYITAGGEVYHTDKECTHLLRYIKSCEGSEIAKLRNSSGAMYYPCQLCKTDTSDTSDVSSDAGEGDYIYYTEYGTRYHNNNECTELKRDIQKVRKSSVSNRRACIKCGGQAG